MQRFFSFFFLEGSASVSMEPVVEFCTTWEKREPHEGSLHFLHTIWATPEKEQQKKKRSNRASLGILQEGSRRKRSPPLSTDFAGLLPLQAVKEHAEMFHFCQRLFLG